MILSCHDCQLSLFHLLSTYLIEMQYSRILHVSWSAVLSSISSVSHSTSVSMPQSINLCVQEHSIGRNMCTQRDIR